MNQQEQMRERVVALFRERMQIAVPDADAELLESGLLDSAGLVDLLLQLEDLFGVTLQMEEFEMDDFRNCDAIARRVLAAREAGTAVGSAA